MEKSSDFAGIFKANLAENQSIKKGRFCGYFLEANKPIIGLALTRPAFLMFF